MCLLIFFEVIAPGGAVGSIGNAGGFDLPTTVYPFILRGITLAGIDAAGPSVSCRNDEHSGLN